MALLCKLISTKSNLRHKKLFWYHKYHKFKLLIRNKSNFHQSFQLCNKLIKLHRILYRFFQWFQVLSSNSAHSALEHQWLKSERSKKQTSMFKKRNGIEKERQLQTARIRLHSIMPRECAIIVITCLVERKLEMPQYARTLTGSTTARECAWTAT